MVPLDRGGRERGAELDLFPRKERTKGVCDTIYPVGEDACEEVGGEVRRFPRHSSTKEETPGGGGGAGGARRGSDDGGWE